MDGKKPKIFVIDDDEAILEAITFCLEDEGYTVRTIRKTEEVVAEAIVFSPQLILLDLFLSGRDGKDVVKALKADRRTSIIPIVLFSAHPTGRKEATALGVAGFLPKPFDTHELFHIIEAHRLK